VVASVEAFLGSVKASAAPTCILLVEGRLPGVDLEELGYTFETLFPKKTLGLVLCALPSHPQAPAAHVLLDPQCTPEQLKAALPWVLKLAEARAQGAHFLGKEQEPSTDPAPLMGSVLHNLNNALGVLIGYIDITRMKATDEGQKNALEVMRGASESMNLMFKNLGKVFLETSYPQHPIKLEHLIEGAIRDTAESFGLSPQALQGLSVEYVCDPATVVVTHGPMFVKTLSRVLKNAYECYPDATPAAKRLLQIQANVVDQDLGQQLRIRVKDAGPGLDPTIAEKAHEPFTSTKPGHKGLGLALGRQAMRSLGGQLIIQPNEPQGVTLTLLQPFVLPEENKETP